MRLSILVLGFVLAGTGLAAQGPQVVDLGGGIYQAVGAGIQGSGVRVPQSNTFLIATSGIATWREPGSKVIAHRLYPEFLEYTNCLAGYFAKSNLGARFQW